MSFQGRELSNTVNRGQRCLLWFLIGIALMTVVVVGRACILRPSTNYSGSHYNRGANASWLGVKWANETHSTHEIAALSDGLKQHQIQEIFVYTSYLRSDEKFASTYDHLSDFVLKMKKTNPALHIQAWIGLPLGYIDLSDPAVRKKIVQFCADIVRTTGVDGIHLDPEPISTEDKNVLFLLDELRDALGPGPTLSVATRRIWPILPEKQWPFVGQLAWRASYYREIARRVDQIAVMTYDSAMPYSLVYCQWVRFQVIEVSQAVDGTGVQVFFGIPTSEERTWTHWPWAENMRSGLKGLIDGLNDDKTRSAVVTGVAIYPYWETDDAEWRVYEKLWLEAFRK